MQTVWLEHVMKVGWKGCVRVYKFALTIGQSVLLCESMLEL